MILLLQEKQGEWREQMGMGANSVAFRLVQCFFFD